MQTHPIRLFVDMDGTLAEWRQLHIDLIQYEDAVSISDIVSHIIRQPGYYKSLVPQQNIVDAIRYLCQISEIEVFILSCYPDKCNAKAEKEEWIDKFLPEIDSTHRIFVPDGQPKKNYVPGGITEKDYLLDDYTYNLSLWNPEQGIKLYNGINGTNKTWKGNALSYKSSPENLVNHLLEITLHDKKVIHTRPQDLDREDYTR